MSLLPILKHTSTRSTRVHCPYCGDNFLLSHGMRLDGSGVTCPNVKCGSRIRMSIQLPEEEATACRGH